MKHRFWKTDSRWKQLGELLTSEGWKGDLAAVIALVVGALLGWVLL